MILREALSGAWSYSQAQLFVRDMHDEVRDAWKWMTPRVREALVAERAFAVVRGNHRPVEPKDMDKLLAAMRVAAGLATLEEVT